MSGRTGAGFCACLLYTSDAADERSSVDLGGRRIIKKKNKYRKWAHQSQGHKNENGPAKKALLHDH